MLSLIPYLLSHQQISPFLIRLTLGGILVYWTYVAIKDKSKKSKALDIAQGLLGILIIIGLWTQLAALILAIGFVVCLVGKFRSKTLFTNGVNYVFILLILAISLMFTGAGWMSFDLPV